MIHSIIKILLIDPCKERSHLIENMVESSQQIKVICCCNDIVDAKNYLSQNKPNVIALHIDTPYGLNFIKEVMHTQPVPILLLKDLKQTKNEKELEFLLEGALLIEALDFTDHVEPLMEKFVTAIKTLSEVRLITRKAKFIKKTENNHPPIPQQREKIQAVGIGASVGGPGALGTIFSDLSENFPATIFVVQHISKGFTPGLVSWLTSFTSLPITIAKQEEVALPGHIYFAPDNAQMCIKKGNIIHLQEKQNKEICPSVSKLFRSMAETFGKNCIAVILTGMGRDGAEELLLLKNKGAHTIVQDEKSCIVFGMPQSAIEIGAAAAILPISEIGKEISKRVGMNGLT
jgi:two-component system chemotaxis response regulator CheB